MATEKDPRERHLYRARLDGTGRSRLTKEDGTHRVLVSPDGRHFADIRSSLEAPPALVVSSTDGLRTTAIVPEKAPEAAGLRARDLRVVRAQGARRGRPLWPAPQARGLRSRPAVPGGGHVYGGPGVQNVRNAWTDGFDQVLASRGFLVFSLDNRGTTGRGHAFERPLFKDMGRVELEDQLVGVAHLKTLPYVDPQRLGIFGWSYGGYLTLYALTHAPDVWKAGVAGAPVTDWTFYDSIYTERYMGLPKDNPKGYESSSPLKKAGELKADLLLIHGTADDNVHLANTMSFADASPAPAGPTRCRCTRVRCTASPPGRTSSHRDAATLRHFEATLKP